MFAVDLVKFLIMTKNSSFFFVLQKLQKIFEVKANLNNAVFTDDKIIQD